MSFHCTSARRRVALFSIKLPGPHTFKAQGCSDRRSSSSTRVAGGHSARPAPAGPLSSRAALLSPSHRSSRRQARSFHFPASSPCSVPPCPRLAFRARPALPHATSPTPHPPSGQPGGAATAPVGGGTEGGAGPSALAPCCHGSGAGRRGGSERGSGRAGDVVLRRSPPQLPLPARGWVSRRRRLGATGAAAVLCHIVSGPARPGLRLPLRGGGADGESPGRAARRQRVRPALGVGRGGGRPVTRRDIFVPRRIGAPRGGAPGARLRRSVGCRGCGAEASTAPRGVRSFSGGKDRPEGASRSGRRPGELSGNLRRGSCSESRGSPRHVAARAPLGAGRARLGVPVRPVRDGWAGRSSARAAPRATRENLGRGPRMWGGDPGPLSRLLGRAPSSLAGGSREEGRLGTWTV